MQRTDYGRFAVLVLLVVVLYYVARIVWPFLPALAWAAILATIFYPVFDRIARLFRRRRLASATTCVLITLAIVLPVMVLLFLLAGESVNTYRMLEARIKSGGTGGLTELYNSSHYQWFLAKLRELGLPEPDLSDAAVRGLRGVSEFLVGHSASLLRGFMHFALNFFVMLLALYYLFLHGPDILREFSRLNPLRQEHEVRIAEIFRSTVQATFAGSLATALIQGTAGGLAFLFFGLPAPLLWGAVMAVLSLVPVVGTALVWGPVAIYYLLTGSVWKGLLLLLIFGGIVGSIDNVVKPLLIKRGTTVHTLWIFLGILGGVSVFGFLGFVLGPFLVTIMLALIEIYKVEFGEKLGKNSE